MWEAKGVEGASTPLSARIASSDTVRHATVVGRQKGRCHEALGDRDPRKADGCVIHQLRQARVLLIAPIRSGLWHLCVHYSDH